MRRNLNLAFGTRFDSYRTDNVKPELLDWGLPHEFQHRTTELAPILTSNVAELLDESATDIGTTQELVFASILSPSSTVVQCLYDVQHPNASMKPIPASIYVLATAGSAQRKSTALSMFTKVAEGYQKSESKNDVQIKIQEAQERGWKRKYQQILSKIEENFDDPEMVQELKEKLEALGKTRPERGKSGINLINRDTSLSALMQGLETQSSSSSSVQHEARDMLPQLGRWMGILNDLWDGAPIKRDRSTMASVLQFDPRFSIAWIIQPQRWKQYVESYGEDFLESGLGGRFLVVACPDRELKGEMRRHSIARTARDRHDTLMKKLIDTYDEKLKAGKADVRQELKRSVEADKLFMKTYTWIERNLDRNGYFAEMREFGGRCAENIMRVAGVLHVIEGRAGTEIAEDIMRSAILVMRFMAEQHHKMFGNLRKPAGELYAEKVEQYLLRCFNSGTVRDISVRQIQQFVGSAEIRSKRGHVTDALEFLAKWRIVQLHYGKNQIESVTLNWDHFDRLKQSSTFLKRS